MIYLTEVVQDWFEIRLNQEEQEIYQDWLKDWLWFTEELYHHFSSFNPIRDTTITLDNL